MAVQLHTELQTILSSGYRAADYIGNGTWKVVKSKRSKPAYLGREGVVKLAEKEGKKLKGKRA